ASSATAAAGSETRPSSRPRPRTAATKTPSKSASRTRFLQAVGNFNPNILGSPPSMTPKNASQAAPGVSPIISSSRNLSQDDVGLNDFLQSQESSNIVLLIGKESLISYMPTRKKTKGPFGFRPSNATLC
uniref:Uncharacterized protein n=1 Tax=Triticum urartu TaxID=4572 RepID=A0A8R7P5G0_TRIUA